MVCLEDLPIENVFNLIKNNLMSLQSFEDWVLDRETTFCLTETKNSYNNGYARGYDDCLNDCHER